MSPGRRFELQTVCLVSVSAYVAGGFSFAICNGRSCGVWVCTPALRSSHIIHSLHHGALRVTHRLDRQTLVTCARTSVDSLIRRVSTSPLGVAASDLSQPSPSSADCLTQQHNLKQRQGAPPLSESATNTSCSVPPGGLLAVSSPCANGPALGHPCHPRQGRPR
jgi:hypothetical protein